MTNKIQKIREGIEKLKSQLLRGACSSQVAMEARCKEEAYNDVLGILYSMQEESVSNPTPNKKMSVERWKTACEAACCDTNYRSHYGLTETRDDYFVDGVQWADEHHKEEPVSEDLEEAADSYIKTHGEILGFGRQTFKAGAKWQKLQDMGITNKAQDVVDDVLSSADSPLDAYATEVAFIMLPATLKESYHHTNRDRISDAVRLGANWQKEHLWKPADGDDLPEYEREVVVLIQPYPLENSEYAVSFAHRPNPDGWDGKSISTGKVEHYTPKTYDKGGWNIPDVKRWLDCSLPNMEDD